MKDSMNAEEFYNERMKKGQTYSITSNDAPDYSLPFYQSIFWLMEDFAGLKNKDLQSQLKERDEENQKLKFAILQFAKQGTKLLEEVNKIETSKTK